MELGIEGRVAMVAASSKGIGHTLGHPWLTLGGYGPHSYLLFPVIPPPWSTRARRDGSPSLSPATGISAGSLDWWAHESAP